MSQQDFVASPGAEIYDPKGKGGGEMVNALNLWKQALHSNHKGAARPSYVVAGMTWVKEVSATEEVLNYYDGSVDYPILRVNPQTHTNLSGSGLLLDGNVIVDSNGVAVKHQTLQDVDVTEISTQTTVAGNTTAEIGLELSFSSSVDYDTKADVSAFSNINDTGTTSYGGGGLRLEYSIDNKASWTTLNYQGQNVQYTTVSADDYSILSISDLTVNLVKNKTYIFRVLGHAHTTSYFFNADSGGTIGARGQLRVKEITR